MPVRGPPCWPSGVPVVRWQQPHPLRFICWLILFFFHASQLLFAAAVGAATGEEDLTTGEEPGINLDSEAPPLTVATTAGSAWATTADEEIFSLLVAEADRPLLDGGPRGMVVQPEERGPLKKPSVLCAVGFTVVVLMWLWRVATLGAAARRVVAAAQGEPFIYELDCLYAGKVDQQKAREAAARWPSASLLSLQEDAVQLCEFIDCPEARGLVSTLQRSTQEVRREEQRLDAAAPGAFPLATAEAAQVAQATHMRAALSKLRQSFDAALDEAHALHRLAERFVADALAVGVSFSNRIKQQRMALQQLEASAKGLFEEAPWFRVYVQRVGDLAAEAERDLALVQSLSAHLSASRFEVANTSLELPLSASQAAVELVLRIQKATNEVTSWAEDAERAAQVSARHLFAELSIQLAGQQSQLEQTRLFSLHSPIPADDAAAEPHKHVTKARHLKSYEQQLQQQQRAFAGLKGLEQTTAFFQQAFPSLKAAASLTWVAAARPGGGGPPAAPSADLAGTPPGASAAAAEEVQEGGPHKTAQRLHSQLLSAVELAARDARGGAAGVPFSADLPWSTWDPPAGCKAEEAKPANFPVFQRLAAVHAEWVKEVEAAQFAAAAARRSMELLQASQQQSGHASAMSEDCVELAALAVLRYHRAAKLALEGRAWERVQQWVAGSFRVYTQLVASAASGVSDAELLRAGELSEEAVKAKLLQIGQQQEVTSASALAAEFSFGLSKLQQQLTSAAQAAASKPAGRPAADAALLPPPLSLEELKAKALQHALTARQLVTRAEADVRLLAGQTQQCGASLLEGPEARSAAAAARAAQTEVSELAGRFASAFALLQGARTNKEVAQAGFELVRLKEEVLSVARGAHFSYQQAVLTLLHAGQLGKIAAAAAGEGGDGGGLGGPQPLRWGAVAADLQEAKAAALAAVELREQLVIRALLELRKFPSEDGSIAQLEGQLQEEGSIVGALVRHIHGLSSRASGLHSGEGGGAPKTGARGPQTDPSGALLLAEANGCLKSIWQLTFVVDTLVQDKQNSLDMVETLVPLLKEEATQSAEKGGLPSGHSKPSLYEVSDVYTQLTGSLLCRQACSCLRVSKLHESVVLLFIVRVGPRRVGLACTLHAVARRAPSFVLAQQRHKEGSLRWRGPPQVEGPPQGGGGPPPKAKLKEGQSVAIYPACNPPTGSPKNMPGQPMQFPFS
ncbi:hypothetical protein Efla_002583 [Eimeria flavescens]